MVSLVDSYPMANCCYHSRTVAWRKKKKAISSPSFEGSEDGLLQIKGFGRTYLADQCQPLGISSWPWVKLGYTVADVIIYGLKHVDQISCLEHPTCSLRSTSDNGLLVSQRISNWTAILQWLLNCGQTDPTLCWSISEQIPLCGQFPFENLKSPCLLTQISNLPVSFKCHSPPRTSAETYPFFSQL